MTYTLLLCTIQMPTLLFVCFSISSSVYSGASLACLKLELPRGGTLCSCLRSLAAACGCEEDSARTLEPSKAIAPAITPPSAQRAEEKVLGRPRIPAAIEADLRALGPRRSFRNMARLNREQISIPLHEYSPLPPFPLLLLGLIDAS